MHLVVLESLVESPADEIVGLADFLGLPAPDPAVVPALLTGEDHAAVVARAAGVPKDSPPLPLELREPLSAFFAPFTRALQDYLRAAAAGVGGGAATGSAGSAAKAFDSMRGPAPAGGARGGKGKVAAKGAGAGGAGFHPGGKAAAAAARAQAHPGAAPVQR